MTTLHTGLSPHLRVTKRVAALLLLPLTLLLSACHTDADITVTAAGGVYINVDIVGDEDKTDTSAINCDAYGLPFNSFPGEVHVTDLTSDTTTDVLCNISASTDNGMDGQLLIDNDSSYILNIPVKDFLADTDTDKQGTYRLTVHMPGDIIFTGDGGKIDGSKVVYEGKISNLKGDIKVEASKSDGTPFAVWIVGFLVVLLGGALGVSRFLRTKHPSPDEDSAKPFSAKNGKDGKKSTRSQKDAAGVAVSTADSAVALAPLPAKYSPKNIDGISESYSEQIDMVSPIPQGSAADVVKRENVLLALPSETADVLPIPGMPPRIPISDFVQGEADEVKGSGEGEPETESETSAFFSSLLDSTDDEDIDEETDL